MVFQEPRLLPWRSALDNAALGLKALGVARSARRAQAAALLAEHGLTAADLDKRPAALSAGMRQRVAIARALAVRPAVLVLDKPFAALDPGLRAELQHLLRALVARLGVAAMLSTHDLVEAVRLGGALVLPAGNPAGTALCHALPACADDAAVFETCGALLRCPAIAAGLGLAATVNSAG